MRYKINDTSLYHIDHLETLGWEYTVCNSLENEKSPIRSILKKSASYGSLLFDFLRNHLDFKNISNIIEVGGGYGNLMRDFLQNVSGLNAHMVDISEYLLMKQKETLKGYNAEFTQDDFFNLNKEFFSNFDLAILNENAGDFPTILDIDRDILKFDAGRLDPVELKIRGFYERYSLSEKGMDKDFNFNLGAMEALEKLCAAGIPNIFICEHSCEAVIPDSNKNPITRVILNFPEKIQLKGHDEYTIKFSYLESIGKNFHYNILRSYVKDFIKIDEGINITALLYSTIENDRMEILRQFLYDLYKYEFILIYK